MTIFQCGVRSAECGIKTARTIRHSALLTPHSKGAFDLRYRAAMNWLRNPRFYPDGLPAVGLLLLRVFMGYAMAMHGLAKMSSPFHWMDGMAQMIPGFVPPPSILQALGAAGEFFGGLGLMFGLLTPIAALGVMGTMFVATLFILTHAPAPHYFIKPMGEKGGSDYESSATYFIFALTLFLTGPGLLSIDAFLFGRKRVVAAPAVAPTPAPTAPVKTS